ncbi:MAG: 30S ribosomal protein S16 [Patescibacteria group bacterium]
MLRIRLQRVGRKHETAFRVVVVDSRRGTKSGRALEIVGSYDPRRGKPSLKTDRIKHWLSVGAQASGTAHNLLVDTKIVAGPKVNVLPKRKPKEKVETKATDSITAVASEVAPTENPATITPLAV